MNPLENIYNPCRDYKNRVIVRAGANKLALLLLRTHTHTLNLNYPVAVSRCRDEYQRCTVVYQF